MHVAIVHLCLACRPNGAACLYDSAIVTHVLVMPMWHLHLLHAIHDSVILHPQYVAE